MKGVWYQRSCLEAEERITQEGSSKDITTKFSLPHGIDNLCTRFPTCKELLQSVERVIEKPNELPLTDMIELEEELNAALLHTRSREERKLAEDTEELKQQVASAKQNNDEVDSGGRGLTLPLF
ncbi:hypothetical protein Tco_0358908 [Tanacetum coccineum]